MKTLALFSLGLLVATGCTYTVHTVQPTAYQAQGYVTVNSAPPPLRADVMPAARPRANAYWVAGHWSWEGRWVWVAGQWQAPRAGYVWQEPVAAQAGTGYRYYPGYWRRGSQRPPAVYQRPGTIRVAVRPPARRGYGAPPRQGVVVQRPGRRPQRPGVV
ncbi:MAG: hypothetical protein GXP55_24795, partial [Deltaproteobacteria bacterium]|nr:hypothetical protein [Deltaproteobacteria bacterium]